MRTSRSGDEREISLFKIGHEARIVSFNAEANPSVTVEEGSNFISVSPLSQYLLLRRRSNWRCGRGRRIEEGIQKFPLLR